MNLRSKSIGPTNDFEKGLMTFLRNEKEEKKNVYYSLKCTFFRLQKSQIIPWEFL